MRVAIAHVCRAIARSESLLAVRVLGRKHECLAKRCAWCGRLDLGDHWTPPDDVPAFLPRAARNRVTHGICPDCLARLERDGQTHSLQRPA
jgi:hypothetical protein